MERGSGKPPFFDRTNYPYMKIYMSTYLQDIDWRVWEICEDATYVVLGARVTQEQIDQHNANSRARSVLFLSHYIATPRLVIDGLTLKAATATDNLTLKNYSDKLLQIV